MSIENSLGQFDGLRHIRLPDRPRNEYGRILFIGDLFAVLFAWYIANQIFFAIPIPTTFVGPANIPVIEIFTWERSAVIFAMIFLLQHMGHYRDRIHYFFQLRAIFLACFFGLIGESVIRLYLNAPTSISGLIIAWGLMALLIMSFRVITASFICSKDRFLQPVIILSEGVLGNHMREAVKRKTSLGYRLATTKEAGGFTSWISIASKAADAITDDALLELREKASRTNEETLILYAFDKFDQESVSRSVKALETLGRPFGFVSSQTGIRLPFFKEFPLFGEDLILLLPDRQGPSKSSRIAKRLFDIVVSGVALVIFTPFFLLVSLLSRRDGGPTYFTQDRIGRDGRHFKCLKFRTMVVDAEQKLTKILEDDPAARLEWQDHQKLTNDPRITNFGKRMRKGSLDELPQLINVFKGEMSIVGPRPCFDGQVEAYGKRFASYLSVRPGITGLWQVSGRNNTTFEERAELEAWYVDNWSLWLDIFILVKTIPVVLFARGAH